MEDYSNYCCSLCKNHCPVNARKCPDGMSLEQILEHEKKTSGRCTMCDKLCPYDALECSTGRMIARIKGWGE